MMSDSQGTWESDTLKQGIHVWSLQETLPSARSSFGILHTANYVDSSMPWENMSMKPLWSLWDWTWEKRSHKITVLSLDSKMATPLYASAKACVMHSVPKSDISEMQVDMTQSGCLIMEFSSLPRTLPSYWNKHPFFFTVTYFLCIFTPVSNFPAAQKKNQSENEWP